MGSLLRWVHDLPISIWVAQSDSLWSFPFVLFLHTMGIALTAGTTFIVTSSVLGGLGPVSPPSLRTLFSWFWAGFVLNAVTGSLLFMAAATETGYKPTYYLKLAFLTGGVLTFVPIGAFLAEDVGARTDIPLRIKLLAAASLLCWAAVIATGRLIAYF